MFQFTHPGRGATLPLTRRLLSYRFQFTHPGRGATESITHIIRQVKSFNSRTPGGVRPESVNLLVADKSFQFTHPGRGATARLGRRERSEVVSIHAPREGCDLPERAEAIAALCFNSRTPGGVRPPPIRTSRLSVKFQFTHPGRGATLFKTIKVSICDKFQFTHPGRGATASRLSVVYSINVSIHAPREGCDSR